MSDETPDRLRAFRAHYAPAKAPSNRMAVVQTVVLVAGFAGVFALLLGQAGQGAPGTDATRGGLSARTARDLAVYLAERQHPIAAVAAYQAYLDREDLEPEARARVCYSMAKLAIDAEQFDTALTYLYQAEFLAPDSDLRAEIDKKVVLCLDRLGRGVDLRKALRKRTAVKRAAADVDPGETVLAEFGDEVITDRDLALEIEKLPPYMRDSIAGPEERAGFLKNLVAQRLLVDKARRLGLDEDPGVQAEMVAQLDAMIVRKLIADEVATRIHVTPEDVERFYNASIDRFTEPATAKVRIGRGDSAEAVQALEALPSVPVTVRQGRPIPGLPGSDAAVEAAFAAGLGGRVGPYESDGAWYVLEVVSKTPERVRPFDEVRDEARRTYEARKHQEELAALIERVLEERDVRLHLERLEAPDESS